MRRPAPSRTANDTPTTSAKTIHFVFMIDGFMSSSIGEACGASYDSGHSCVASFPVVGVTGRDIGGMVGISTALVRKISRSAYNLRANLRGSPAFQSESRWQG